MGQVRLVLALLAAIALSALAGARAAEEPFEIPTIESLTGGAAFVGTNTIKAIAAAEELANRTGGIRGRPLKFTIADDQTNPQLAVQIMSQILAKKPALVIGGMLASTCNAPAGLLKEDGPVFWCYSPGVRPPAGSWLFTTSYTSGDMLGAAVRYFRLRGYTKLAVLTSTDATGQDADRGIAEALAKSENSSVSVVEQEHFGISDITVSAQLGRIRAAGAQVLITYTTGTPFGTVLRGLQQADFTIPIFSSPGNSVPSQLESYKSIWPNAPIITLAPPVMVPEAVTDRRVRGAIQQFTGAMKAAHIERPDIGEMIAWDMLMMVIDTYRALGTNATAAQVRDHLAAIRGRPGIYGMIDFQANPQRGHLPDWMMIVRYDPLSGKFTALSKPGGAPL
jgi:branched-chain amino acid transport system substrate-binding protein